MSKKNKQCDHNFKQIHPSDPIGSVCKKCGIGKETNPYTGEEDFISEKQVRWRYNHFEKERKEYEERKKKYLPKQFNSEGKQICGARWCNKVLGGMTYQPSEWTMDNAHFCSKAHVRGLTKPLELFVDWYLEAINLFKTND